MARIDGVLLRRHALATVAALSVCTMASIGLALPAPPAGTTGLHYFCYFTDVSYDDAPSVYDHANVVLYGDALGDDKFQTSLPKIKRLRANPSTQSMGVVLSVYNQFFFPGGVPFDQVDTNPAHWPPQSWKNFRDALAPYASSLVSFYVIDEPPTSAAMATYIAKVAAQLKADFPKVHVQVTYTAQDIDNDVWTIPNGVDWVGYDCYPGPFETECFAKEQYAPGDGRTWRSVPYYYNKLKTAIARSHLPYQAQLVLIPEAWELSSTIDPSPEAQATILSRSEREIALAESDPSFAMIMPFLWDSVPSVPSIGAADLPMVKTYYQALGQHIVNGSARLAYPTSVGASSSYSVDSAPNRAFDYANTSAWNAGGYADAAIWASFADPITLSKLSLVTAQSPAGQTQHVVKSATSDTFWPNLATFTGFTSDNQTLTWSGSQPSNWLYIDTLQSPSWVGWREVDVWTTGSTRLYPIPLASTTAGTALLPSLVDGDGATIWTAFAYAPQSVDLDLGRVQTLSHIDLVVAQTPAGATTHIVYGGPALNQLRVLGTLSQFTQDGQDIALSGSFGNVRYLRVTTSVSPSWVGWREINVFR